MDYTTLIVKNIPKNIRPADFFKRHYNAIAARYYGRARAVVRFENEINAKNALLKLHQSQINNCIISAEYLGKRELIRPLNEDAVTKESSYPELSDFASRLLGTSAAHGFYHPPPPHLKYSYPKINRDILDAISIQLMSNSKFYTQVLHLMNRMNLEPPFLERKKSFIPPGEARDVQTQTDFEKMHKLLASDESEMESSGEEEPEKKRNKLDNPQEDKEKLKTKILKVLKSEILLKGVIYSGKSNAEQIDTVFESTEKNTFAKTISMNVSSVRLPEKVTEIVEESSDNLLVPVESEIDNQSGNLKFIKENELTISHLEENRIPENQLREMPIYKNYHKGEKTNKLYIKNLSKDVTIEDLQKIYKIFVNDTETELEIKLMQHGRMKGQAFVSFLKVDENNLDNINKALYLTNGFILKNKPMIVCFGKK